MTTDVYNNTFFTINKTYCSYKFTFCTVPDVYYKILNGHNL